MLAKQLLLLSSLVPLIQGETVLGVYIFHRHGDRTSKSFPPASLTDLGYTQVFASGDFYRKRYVESNATSQIFGISPDIAHTPQLSVEAPVDPVLQNSAGGFLQGLYPPVGNSLGSQQLANGTVAISPLNGFQLIPVNAVASVVSGANSESTSWLQGSSGCPNAITSSNSYFFSADYLNKLSSTHDFYQSILPVINNTYNSTYDTFFNAYSIFDLIHVSAIHNLTIQSDNLLTPETLFQLQTLADAHEFGLAYNASQPIRAIAGATLAAQILQQLNATIVGKSAVPWGMQFGTYAAFFSFFGLAQLPQVSENFTGIVDYASAMTFELVTNATVSKASYPTTDEISVRFLFSNGSASANPLNAYPLFGQTETVLPWSTFVTEMNKIAIGTQSAWCSACGLTTGVCAATSTSTTTTSSPTSSPSSKSGGISRAVAGVIGAIVTLVVVLGLEGLLMLAGGFTLAKKHASVAAGSPPASMSPSSKA